MKRALALLACCCVPLACQTPFRSTPTEMKRFDDEVAMKEEVLKYVPVGTPVQQARAIMKAQGWEYTPGERPNDGKVTFLSTNPYAELSFWSRFYMEDTIAVTFTCKDGKVTDAAIAYGQQGL